MPQLGFNGLSENWLLKECGHRHWSMICARAGVPSHEITDARGHRLYAAFVAIEIGGNPLARFNENDVVKFRTDLVRFSSKRFHSHTRLTTATGTEVEVQMVSIFVRKPIFDDNRSIAAGHPDPLRSIEIESPPSQAERLISAWKEAKQAVPRSVGPVHTHRICPTVEFNGARLLYFANFQRILDQAEWSSLDATDMQFASTTRRRFQFFGNVNFDDVLEVHFENVAWTGASRSHRASVRRQGDGALLAVVETAKQVSTELRDPTIGTR